MSSRALTPFTARPEYSFVGASRTSSMGRCDPVPFESDDTDERITSDCWLRFPVYVRPNGERGFFDICVPSEGEVLTLSEADAYRLLCHTLIQRLPDIAFKEAVDALTGMCEFYRHTPSLPAPVSGRSTKARITGSYTAPVFPVTED